MNTNGVTAKSRATLTNKRDSNRTLFSGSVIISMVIPPGETRHRFELNLFKIIYALSLFLPNCSRRKLIANLTSVLVLTIKLCLFIALMFVNLPFAGLFIFTHKIIDHSCHLRWAAGSSLIKNQIEFYAHLEIITKCNIPRGRVLRRHRFWRV